ncbi:hypothetical protein [Ichthyobacterium seriolicida]|uniref:Uncharacterized protein n=1 Tax=Ichthyobacterium seriolicida TaxID=242600 RepID=A0A1J1E9F9_9FLAO|nr:hypothetical protein [Ichthyobacterium seriolicida]BAV94539.1 hypothetical protein JBKA6_0526 [Ichthyobacterium seriolicida]
MKISRVVYVLFLFTNAAFGQYTSKDTEAKGMSLAGAMVSDNSFYSLYHNISGLCSFSGMRLALNYSNKFTLKETSNKSIALAFDVYPNNVFAVELSNYGFYKYSENKIFLGYAKKIHSNIFGGIGLYYQFLDVITSTKKSHLFYFSMGLQFIIDDDLSIGVHISNPTLNKYSHSYIKKSYPSNFQVGIKWNINSHLVLYSQLQKELYSNICLQMGLEHSIKKYVYVRIGLDSNFDSYNIGVSMKYSPLDINLSVGYHTRLNFTPSVSTSYKFY